MSDAERFPALARAQAAQRRRARDYWTALVVALVALTALTWLLVARHGATDSPWWAQVSVGAISLTLCWCVSKWTRHW